MLIQFDDSMVRAANNQQRGSGDIVQAFPGQIWAPAAGDDSADPIIQFRGGQQCGGRACAGAKQANGQGFIAKCYIRPFHCFHQPHGKEWNIKDARPTLSHLFIGMQKVKQQGCPSRAIERFGDLMISHTEAT